MSYLAFEAVTPLGKKEVLESLESALTETNWLGRPKNSRPFIGKISGSNFKIKRVVFGRDAFNPVVNGYIWSADHRTHISVRMTLHPVGWAFLVLYSVFLGGGFLPAFFGSSGDTTNILFLLFLFPWLLGIPLFFYNASKSKRLLKERLRLIVVTKGGG